MITAIVARLKTGRITNVVQYGVREMPGAPYVVVRMISEPGVGRQVVIFPHMLANQNIFLEDYTINDLSLLLSDFRGVSRHGNRFKLTAMQDWQEIVTNNDDGTISMERRFLAPTLLF
jgi:hypothetical protein